MLVIFITAFCEAKVNQWDKMKEVYENIPLPTFPDKTYLITDYYNGTDSLFTSAINKAILVCSAQGGGVVVIPDGVYKTAPIRMKSNVNLHLSDKTLLMFTTDYNLFDTVLTRIEGIDCYNISPLIYAYGETNMAITGNGVMDGMASEANWFSKERIDGVTLKNGKKVAEKTVLYDMKEDSVPFEKRVFKGKTGMRPQFINLYKCKNVLLEGFTLNRSPFWLIHPLLSENITVRKVKMQSHGHNNDGCDPESCKNILIEDCDFDTGDDCIAIKSGRDEDGRYWNIPSENIIVRNCRMKDGHAGVAMGSEITGGCYNVWVENCLMDSPNLSRIIRIKSNAIRGGEVKNVYVRNITVGQCDESILGMEMKYWHVDDGPYPPYFHNIYLENIKSNKSRYLLHLDGFANKIQARDIFIKNCDFKGITASEINAVTGVSNIHFENVKVNGKDYKGM
ncbi:Glycosyl hydrolases family 28 [Bacteroides luti]|uniref:Glycosyl hydrolases family 28 n=1 Tax=Bacteroides luti TaxID=1297750 RepID=A0A1M5GCL1_9BACE|nr:Glycosyl hydrolases family 28 [Bacteroides luti]